MEQEAKDIEREAELFRSRSSEEPKMDQREKVKDGGPALTGMVRLNRNPMQYPPVDMTLRQWYAGMAPDCPGYYFIAKGGHSAAVEAEWRFEYADAMISEGEKTCK